MPRLLSLRPDREYESAIGEHRVAQGLTIRELSEASGASQQMISGLQNGMISPVYEDSFRCGHIKPSAKSVCEALAIDLEDAFPRYFCKIRTVGSDFTQEQIDQIVHSTPYQDPLSAMLRAEAKSFLTQSLSLLLPREADVLMCRYGIGGGHIESYHVLAEKYGVTRERIRQIEFKALRKLRHPSRTAYFAEDTN
jgi:transcriptional regulator with XRE-family HTH domain